MVEFSICRKGERGRTSEEKGQEDTIQEKVTKRSREKGVNEKPNML